MSKGENIFKRRDGRWEARYIKCRDATGKIKYGFCYGKTYHEAKEKVTKAKAAIIAGLPPLVPSQHRFSYFCDEWLKTRKMQVKESTYVKYDTVLNKYIMPKLRGYLPLGFSGDVVNAFTKTLLEEDLSAKSVRDILTILRSILKYTATSLPGNFPDIKINYPKITKPEVRVLSQEEQQMLVTYLTSGDETYKLGILLALLTGIRIGELCALRWKDISLDERKLCVRTTVQRIRDINGTTGSKTKVIISTPKSGSSVRVIPLTSLAVKVCKQMNPQNPEAYILTGTTMLMEPRALQYHMSRYAKACGLEGVHCHTLRHTFATRAIEVNFEIKSLSEILGHANTTITLNRYVHSSMQLKRSNMEKLTIAGL